VENARKKILLLSRKYPPSVGGMQSYTRDLVRHLEGIYDVDKIVLGKGQAHLVWFLPYLFAASVVRLMTRKYDLVYLCDAFLAPLGVVLKKMFKVKVMVTVHGLDITYDGFFYQRVVPGAVSVIDKVVAVSASTMEECVKRGVKRERCVLITNGIGPDSCLKGDVPGDFIKTVSGEAGCDLEGKKILLSVGRLVKRKGIDSFISDVIPALGDEYLYLIAGDGPEKKNILDTVSKCGAEDRVRLLGKVSGETLRQLYGVSHVLVMPNRRIDGDPEGFGIVAIEAAGSGLPVVANAVDGIGEAVLNGKTGWLIHNNDREIFLRKIKDPGLDRGEVKKNSRVFFWENIIKSYEKEINALFEGARP